MGMGRTNGLAVAPAATAEQVPVAQAVPSGDLPSWAANSPFGRCRKRRAGSPPPRARERGGTWGGRAPVRPWRVQGPVKDAFTKLL